MNGLDVCHPIELSAVMEMSCIHAVQQGSHYMQLI